MEVSRVTRVFEEIAGTEERVLANIGGRGSSKSYSIAQVLIKHLTEQEGVKIGICRKTFPALRRTCYDLVVGLLRQLGIYPLCEHDKTNHEIRYRDAKWKVGGKIDFFALDEVSKIQSADFNYIWMEEAIEFSWEDYVVLSTALRSPAPEGKRNRIYLSLNPTDANSWIATKLVQQPDVKVIHSTYLDNPTLSDDYRVTLENLIYQDDNFYRVYTLGEWGRLENLIFSKYQQVKEVPQGGKWVYGLDFGYTAPTSLVKVMQAEGDIYTEVKVHKERLTNSDLIELLSHEEKADIFADAGEPQRIEELNRAGYNVVAANRDVKFGIDLMKRQMINIVMSDYSASDALWKEMRGYHYRSKDGVVFEEPVKLDDHAIDATRYGLCGLVQKYGSAVSSTERGTSVIRTLTFAR